MIEFPSWLEECAVLLTPFDVFLVGVHYPLEELERRERDRGNRTMGEARDHLAVVHEIVHAYTPYDFAVDTATPKAP